MSNPLNNPPEHNHHTRGDHLKPPGRCPACDAIRATPIEPLTNPRPVPVPVCPMCDEPIVDDDLSPTVLHTPEGPKNTHRTCMLREVTGGIGHHIAHEYWCTLCGDPDAGLTRRQSALLVNAYIKIVGLP